MTYLVGRDISHYQAATPSLAGVSFVFVRATYGTSADDRYGFHATHVRADRKVLGAYAFGRASQPVRDQVARFLDIARDADLLALDVERDIDGTTMSHAQTVDFISRVHEAGRRIGLYMSESAYRTDVGQDFRWVANWSRKPSIAWDFWQYGGVGGVDSDYFDGTYAELVSLGSGSSSGPIQTAPAGDPMIFSDGIRQGSSHVVEVPQGTDYFQGPDGARIGAFQADEKLDYKGLWNRADGTHYWAVEVHDPDRIVAIAPVGTKRPKTDAELIAQAAEFHAPPDDTATIAAAVNAALDHVAGPVADVFTAIAEARPR